MSLVEDCVAWVESHETFLKEQSVSSCEVVKGEKSSRGEEALIRIRDKRGVVEARLALSGHPRRERIWKIMEGLVILRRHLFLQYGDVKMRPVGRKQS